MLRDKAFNIDKNPKYDKYQHGIESMICKLFGFYEFFDVKPAATHKEKVIYSDAVPENQKLIVDLQKPIIRKFEKQNVHLSFKDNFWGVDLADFLWISRCNKRFHFLLFAIDIFSKHARGFLLKTKKKYCNCQCFSKKNFRWSNCKLNKIDKDGKFNNR